MEMVGMPIIHPVAALVLVMLALPGARAQTDCFASLELPGFPVGQFTGSVAVGVTYSDEAGPRFATNTRRWPALVFEFRRVPGERGVRYSLQEPERVVIVAGPADQAVHDGPLPPAALPGSFLVGPPVSIR